jgi:hypothetical protein
MIMSLTHSPRVILTSEWCGMRLSSFSWIPISSYVQKDFDFKGKMRKNASKKLCLLWLSRKNQADLLCLAEMCEMWVLSELLFFRTYFSPFIGE